MPKVPLSMSKHRTVGISMSPDLEARAKARAEALALKFSPYVTLCIEAELKGFAQIMRDEERLDLEAAVQRAREYMRRKSDSIEFECDVQAVLDKAGLDYERFGRVGPRLRTDFLVPLQNGRNICIECRFNIREQYAVALGQSILLRAAEKVDRVILVVPYLTGFDPEILRQFSSHAIEVATPDKLAEQL